MYIQIYVNESNNAKQNTQRTYLFHQQRWLIGAAPRHLLRMRSTALTWVLSIHTSAVELS